MTKQRVSIICIFLPRTARPELGQSRATPRVTSDEALLYCGKDLHLPDFKTVIEKWQTALYQKGWNSNYLNNHDQPRSVSRFGNDGKYLRESAKLLGMFNFTLSGTPYIYQGEELGMTNVRFDTIDAYRDVAALRYYEKAKRYGKAEPEIMKTIHYRCSGRLKPTPAFHPESRGSA